MRWKYLPVKYCLGRWQPKCTFRRYVARASVLLRQLRHRRQTRRRLDAPFAASETAIIKGSGLELFSAGAVGNGTADDRLLETALRMGAPFKIEVLFQRGESRPWDLMSARKFRGTEHSSSSTAGTWSRLQPRGEYEAVAGLCARPSSVRSA